jgi:hypothetical protein
VKLADYYATAHVGFGLLVQAAALESLRSIRIQYLCGAELCQAVCGFYNIENDRGVAYLDVHA